MTFLKPYFLAKVTYDIRHVAIKYSKRSVNFNFFRGGNSNVPIIPHFHSTVERDTVERGVLVRKLKRVNGEIEVCR